MACNVTLWLSDPAFSAARTLRQRRRRVGGGEIRATGANCSLSGMVSAREINAGWESECRGIGKPEVSRCQEHGGETPRAREQREPAYRSDDSRNVAWVLRDFRLTAREPWGEMIRRNEDWFLGILISAWSSTNFRLIINDNHFRLRYLYDIPQFYILRGIIAV